MAANVRVRVGGAWRRVGPLFTPAPEPDPDPPPGGPVIDALADPERWGWPGPTTTGVPAGTTLTKVGHQSVTTAGAVLDGLDVAGVTIRAPNVVLRRCRIHRTPTPGFGCVRVMAGGSVTIEDSELFYDSPATGDAVVSGAGPFTIARCNIHHVTEGPRLVSGCVVRDSWLHHAVRFPGGHIDLLQVTAGSHIRVEHNTLEAYNPTTGDPFNSCAIFKSDSGPITDLVFRRNLLNGGNHSLYVVGAHHPVERVEVADNRWGRDYRYGPLSVVGVTGLVWARNVWDDDNTPLTV